MLTRRQRIERLRNRLAELALWLDRAWLDLAGWRFEGAPIEVGAPWPHRDGLVHLELDSARVPESWPLSETSLEVAPGGEGLLRVQYASGAQQFGLDPWHQRFPLGEAAFALSVEAVALLPFGRPNPLPRLEAGRLVWVEVGLARFVRRLRLVADAAAALGEDDAADFLISAGERSLSRVLWPSGSEDYLGRAARDPELAELWTPPRPAEAPEPLSGAARESVRVADAALSDDLVRLRGVFPPRGRLALTGHAHIDLAWLWPLEETGRKIRRTFHTVSNLLERYPEMTFTHSSGEAYELVRESDPELFGRVRELVAGGRWEPAGGMWVEPDVNMIGGESIVRQLLWGQCWFERELGGRHRVAWLPDSFGFTPALPQLLRGAGLDGFFTTKLNWSETNRFPHDVFWWEGLDGTRVLAHMFRNEGLESERGLGAYNGSTAPASLMEVWRNFQGRTVHPESLYTIGYGDGGGGPTAEMLEDVRDLAAFPTLPELGFTRVDALFERMCRFAQASRTPVWSGELYLELHRGTLTTQGRTKRLHRRAERDLVAAEVTASVCRLLGLEQPGVDLRRPWRLLLRNQFHDILPGSGIAEVYEQAERELGEVVAAARQLVDEGLGGIAGLPAGAGGRAGVVVVNPDLSERPLRLSLTAPLPGAQEVERGWVLADHRPVAGLEVAVLVGGGGDPSSAARPRPATAEGRVLESDRLRVEVAEDGTVASIQDKGNGREVLAGPGNQLWAYVDRPRSWDAWDLDADYADQGEPVGVPHAIEVVERGPHRAAIRLSWRYRSSSIVQTLRLWSNSPRLEFATELDWHDRRLLLKARFPLAVRAPRATFETAFGVVERPTHRNTSWDAARFEVPGHRFADLSEPGYGVALLNDGRHGYHALGSELGLSLLRSPHHPDPLADEGRHELTYALLPHPGGWLEGGVLMEAEDLNRPLLALPCRSQGEARFRPLAVEGVPLGLAALKPPESGAEGSLVLRLYEPQGARGRARVSLPEGWRVKASLNLLEDEVGEAEYDFGPFEVRTYLLTRG